ncbi:hypothetical protein GQ600_17088 [Phytophthora cactorum]|nr:hypothetical protein GQ600_17088 [Phytophthora cactorum]
MTSFVELLSRLGSGQPQTSGSVPRENSTGGRRRFKNLYAFVLLVLSGICSVVQTPYTPTEAVMSTNSDSNDQADLASQVEADKNNVIGEKTVYLRGISRYLVWLYQNKRSLLSDELLEVVGNNEEAYLVQNEAGVGSLKKDAVLQFMRENTTLTARNEGKPGQSVYDSMRSILFHLYRGYGRSMSVEFAADLTVFFKGLQRTAARQNHDSGEQLTERNDPLPFSLLRSLCQSMMEHGSDEFVFSHTFLLNSWNLIFYRFWSHQPGTRLFRYSFGHAKNDQDGTRPRDARHIYANPFLPEICPVFSLAIYAAVFGLGNSKLLPGGNQYDRFAKLLRCLMEEPNMTNLLLTEGLKPSDIGTHSARKGSATYVSSCSNGGPSAAAICIRAGWTLLGVQVTSIRYEAAGDRIVGRYVAGLPFEETGFAVLPPFFPDIDDSI